MKMNLLLATVASGALVISVGAQAQAQDASTAATASPPANAASVAAGEAGNNPNGDIVVTGFRKSLAQATAIKRSEVTISDAIAAEDIGKFPDTNIAESLQRVTGVQITRDRGTGNAISVRGLAPSFVQTELNGRVLVSGGGRTFNFLSLSPDFVSSVVVEKSPTASMIEGGLSGTVDVRTAKPLDIGKNTIAGRVEGVNSSLRGGVSPRVATIGNFVNSDRTFGVSLGGAYERLLNRTYERQGFGAETGVEANKGIDYNVDGDKNDVYTFDHGQEFRADTGYRERYSAIAGLQWRPSPNFEVYADGLWTRFKDKSDSLQATTRFTNIAPSTPGAPYGVVSSSIDTSFLGQLLPGNVASGQIPSQGFLTTIDADGVDFRADRQPGQSVDYISSGALGFKWNAGRFHLTGEGTYSSGVVHSSSLNTTTYSRASVEISRPNGIGGLSQITFDRGFNPLDPNNFYFLEGDQHVGRSADRIASGRIDASYDVGDGFIKKIEAGAYYSQRRLYSTSAQSTVSAAIAAKLGGFTYNPNVEGGSISDAPFLTQVSPNAPIQGFLPQFLVFDWSKFCSALGGKSAVDQAAPYIEQLGSILNVRERTVAAYTQVDFSDSDNRLSGNIGARFVQTNLSSKGFGVDLTTLKYDPDGTSINPPGTDPLDIRNSYHYVLPSLNLRYNVTDRLVARFAAARVLARPDFNQLGTNTSVNGIVNNINSSNPNLKPYLANQLDLSFEYYLPKAGLVSVAFFYKNVSNFIVNGQTVETYNVLKRDGTLTPVTFRHNEPLNLEKVNVKGIEFGYQLPLNLFTDKLDGLGVFGSATYIDAPKVPAEQNGLPFRLPGVSTFSYNVGGYFEKWGFGAHVYYNWRGKFDTGNGNYFGDREYQLAYGQIDGSLSYDITKNVTTSLDVSNLLDTPIKQVNNFGLMRGYNLSGRTITFGVRAKF